MAVGECVVGGLHDISLSRGGVEHRDGHPSGLAHDDDLALLPHPLGDAVPVDLNGLLGVRLHPEREDPGVVAPAGKRLLDVAPLTRKTVSQGFDRTLLEGFVELGKFSSSLWNHSLLYSFKNGAL